MKIIKFTKAIFILFWNMFVRIPIVTIIVGIVGCLILIKEFFTKTFIFAKNEYKFSFKKAKLIKK